MKPSSTPEENNPGGQHRITRAEYDRLTPAQQGFVTYMQSAWNKEVPNANIYRNGSKQYREFAEGERRAVILVQDQEEDA